MIRQILKNKPIQTKLTTISSFTILIALILVSLITISYQYFSVRNILLNEAKAQANIISNISTAAILFDDTKTANEALESLRASSQVRQAIIFLTNQNVLAHYKNPHFSSLTFPNLPIQPEIRIEWNKLSIIQEILVDKKLIGNLYLEISLNQLYDELYLFSAVVLLGALVAQFIAIVLLQYLGKSIVSPLLELYNMMQFVSKSKNFALRASYDANDEIGSLSKGFNEMLANIEKNKSELEYELKLRQEAEQKLDLLAHYDNVSLLPNRHYFNKQLLTAIESANHDADSIGLMFIDLDNFKIVNDTLGHETGDMLLLEAASRIREAISTHGTVCRIGGDEFAAVMQKVGDGSIMERCAGEILQALSGAFHFKGIDVFIGASIGMSLCPRDSNEFSTLLRSADTAMYHAKAQGKNNYQYYSEEMRTKNLERIRLEMALRHALDNNEFMLHYQPQINLTTQKTTGFEALLRWQHPEMGILEPEIFLSLAEETGLIVPIGEWVFKQACAQLNLWHREFSTELNLSVNLSARQIRHPGAIEKIVNIIQEADINTEHLIIELTESTLMDSKVTLGKLQMLLQLGIRLAVDDFGTGYSSLSYLKQFPVSTLKIDKSFIHDIPHDKNNVAITEAIIAMAKSLNLNLIAEGIETEEQLEFVKKRKCQQAQGYYFGAPLTLLELSDYLVKMD